MRLSDLLKKRVVRENGEKVGHVFDVRVARSPRSMGDRDDQEWRVTGLLVGTRGARERFGITHDGTTGPRHARAAIPWESVVDIEGDRVIVRDDAEPV
jgi:sporulation protein YlmC with PRC-barrel domain